MTNKLLECIEIETDDAVEYTVIWLHGLGASGHDFEPIVPELNLLQRPGVRFLFPHAPVRPITINGGAAMRGWYDIKTLDFDSRANDDDGVAESVQHINGLVDNEIGRGIAESNIILAGFSQGGAIALQAGLTSPRALAGVMALSTYLPMDAGAVAAVDASKMSMPIFMAHGRQDEVIEIRHGKVSHDVLAERGANIEWFDYAMPHSVSADEVHDMAFWFKRLFGM